MNALRAAVSTVTKSPLKRILTSEHRLFSSENKDNDMIDPPDDPIFTIPVPKSRENESFDQRKARLLYQSRKRGMLENDLLLSTFVAKYLNTFTPKQVDLYDKLINGPSNDWDIFYWASEVKQIPDEYNNEIMEMLKLHCKNINKESRIRQPDL